MIAWGQLLHFYQPPWQRAAVLARICHESYRPLIGVFRERPWARCSVNINGVLCQLLAEHGHQDVLDGFAALIASGQWELTGSGAYHPILPLIPASEAAHQVDRNAAIHRQLLGATVPAGGFFPPEMCYGENIDAVVAASGHHWLIVSGVACAGPWPTERIHRIERHPELAVLFRDDLLSNRISFGTIDAAGWVHELQARSAPGTRRYVVTAMDAETYGHHLPGWERDFLAGVYDRMAPRGRRPASVQLATLSELVDRFPAAPPIRPLASSWSTTPEDISHWNPYPLWKSPGNPVHQRLWDHAALVTELVERAMRLDPAPALTERYRELAREQLDPALHSCQWWWASQRPHWEPDLVIRGLELQQRAGFSARTALRAAGLAPHDLVALEARVDRADQLAAELRDVLSTPR